ncbi:uncharacterized protein LOC117651478 [Thrips palmi]|uniref:Uncharacterized protein LOC117651478 n=1 Tax=Thrips palmi TaxID=161013 RepID=A0A6P9A293_THRPL|nr:uncharacterized protein LOC117651478 [Thrips palmi]
MNFQLLSVFALACLAAVLVHAEEEQPHLLVKRSGNGWFKRPNSPTERKTVKDSGMEIHFTHDPKSGQRTTGTWSTGEAARDPSPNGRRGQPSTGGAASTSQKKPKKKGH